MAEGYHDYGYQSAGLGCSHDYLLPKVIEILDIERKNRGASRIFELGCGNGSIANELQKRGFEVQGVDNSESGIRVAREHYPNLKLGVGSVYDDLAGKHGKFPFVLSLEVVEHLLFPRKFARAAYNLLEGGGLSSFQRPTTGTGRIWRWH
jgi:2-polyprenyl-6-hydroxyphenyl methylase/3-demethylubiquinone-9 3-methyltransferase